MHPTASDRSLPAVLLALTASTGLIDAVSYLALGHVFTATSSSSDSPSQGRPVFPSLDPRPLSAPSSPAPSLADGWRWGRVRAIAGQAQRSVSKPCFSWPRRRSRLGR